MRTGLSYFVEEKTRRVKVTLATREEAHPTPPNLVDRVAGAASPASASGSIGRNLYILLLIK